MKIKLNCETRVLAKPQTLEVNDAEAQRLLMLGAAEILKEKVEPKAEPKVEPKEEPEKKEVKKATKK